MFFNCIQMFSLAQNCGAGDMFALLHSCTSWFLLFCGAARDFQHQACVGCESQSAAAPATALHKTLCLCNGLLPLSCLEQQDFLSDLLFWSLPRTRPSGALLEHFISFPCHKAAPTPP